ncbi:putative membrane protein, partial [Bacteroides fragilis str. 3397 T10]
KQTGYFLLLPIIFIDTSLLVIYYTFLPMLSPSRRN